MFLAISYITCCSSKHPNVLLCFFSFSCMFLVFIFGSFVSFRYLSSYLATAVISQVANACSSWSSFVHQPDSHVWSSKIFAALVIGWYRSSGLLRSASADVFMSSLLPFHAAATFSDKGERLGFSSRGLFFPPLIPACVSRVCLSFHHIKCYICDVKNAHSLFKNANPGSFLE